MGDENEGAPAWVPFAESIQWLQIERGSVQHIRPVCGTSTAHGVQQIQEGHWRIEYRVKRSAYGGHGLVLGVADVDAKAWSQKPVVVDEEGDGKKDAKKKDKKGGEPEAPPKFKPGKPAVAWGICTSSGRLISTHEPHIGRFGGAIIGDQLAERRCGSAEGGLTVTVECALPQHTTPVEALMTRRDFQACLHPLDTRREFPLHMRSMSTRSVHHLAGTPVAKPASLSFSINGGEMIRTSVHLPGAVCTPSATESGPCAVACTDHVFESRCRRSVGAALWVW